MPAPFTSRQLWITLATLFFTIGPCATVSAQESSPSVVILKFANGEAVQIDLGSLGLTLLPAASGTSTTLAAPLPGPPLATRAVDITEQFVRWEVPARDLMVEVARDTDRLRVRFTSHTNQELAWPHTGGDRPFTALSLPNGGGLHVPVADPFWRKQLAGQSFDATGGLTLPLWGHHQPGLSIAYMLADEPRTTLALTDHAGKLEAEATHAFRRRDGYPPYEIVIAWGPSSPLQPALAYRRFLQQTRPSVTLATKIAAQPEAGKLLGATHAYVWGTGRTPAALEKLARLGLDHMWLGFDQDAGSDPVVAGPAWIRRARAQGYLVGPYLTFDNVQDPATADTPQSVFDRALFEHGGIQTWQGKQRTGFAGRGHELSSEALARAKRDWIGERLAATQKTGANSVFVDCDAFGDLHDDFTPAHPMTAWRDRENRLARLKRCGAAGGLVLGSETGVGWATNAIHFAHGAHTVGGDLLWQLLGSAGKASFGSWGPTLRPRIFFSEANLGPDFKRGLYDPTCRVPLYQAVFHDVLVTTDRWEFSPVKIKGLVRERTLLELLYLQPAIWNLDLAAIAQHGDRLKALHAFFSPLHRAYGTLPLTDFSWLTPDHRVQRTRFGEDLEMTANFGNHTAFGVPPLAIAAHELKTNRRQVYSPAP